MAKPPHKKFRGNRSNSDPHRRKTEQNRDLATPDRWMPRGEACVEARPPLVVFGGIPGETAKIRVINRGRNQTYAQWVYSSKPSKNRVDPPCERYFPCGGCPLMHLNEKGQRDTRLDLLRYELKSVGLGSISIEKMVASPSNADFRHVVKLTTGRSDRGSPRIGAPGRRRHIVAIPDCTVITPDLRELVLRIYHLFVDMDVHPYHNGEGTLRHVVLRQSSSTDEILVTLVAARRAPILDDLAAVLAGADSKVVGVHLHINAEKTNAIMHRDEEGLIRTRHILGKKTITERLADTNYQVGPGDFFQTNPALADLLYRDVLELCALKEGVPLVDLYCGVGGFALAGAKTTGWAIGVESVGGAVDRARKSASTQDIPAEFVHGEVEEVLSRLTRRLGGRRPTMIVNPARRGLEQGVAEKILQLKPARLVYVSCSPRALAKDLAYFESNGLKIRKVTPYNMFPHSSHQEVVALLESEDLDQIKNPSRGPRRRVTRSPLGSVKGRGGGKEPT